MLEKIDISWNPIKQYLYQDPLQTLNLKILPEIKFYPEKENIFNVFQTPLQNVRVVVLGQDPYFTPNTAIGYAFAVSKESKIPPSLRIIRDEILNSCKVEGFKPDIGEEWKTLEHWREQGIFLLNTALTVEAGNPGSHVNYWKGFTENIIKILSFYNPCIWLLWGAKAKSFIPFISKGINLKDYENLEDIPLGRNYILEAPHPAASLYGGKTSFIGCNHFNITNELLKLNKKKQIIW